MNPEKSKTKKTSATDNYDKKNKLLRDILRETVLTTILESDKKIRIERKLQLTPWKIYTYQDMNK